MVLQANAVVVAVLLVDVGDWEGMFVVAGGVYLDETAWIHGRR